MPAPWEQSVNVFMVTIDGKPASILVDLAAGPHVPLASHPLRLQIRVPMLKPRNDGLRDASELEALGDLEDRFVAALEERCDAIGVGHVIHDGATTIFFYAPESARAALDDLPSIMNDPGEYDPEWLVDEDPEWSLYREFLFPDPMSFQSILNRQLVDTFVENGDDLTAARPVDHRAYFPSSAKASDARRALADGRVALDFTRSDTLADGRPDEFCQEIFELIDPFEGEYDGWGAVHVKSASI
jgi:hypothetical protein